MKNKRYVCNYMIWRISDMYYWFIYLSSDPISKGRSTKKLPSAELGFAPTLPGRATIMTALEKVTDPLIGKNTTTLESL